MSAQAELALRVLMRLYVEFDQRSGWTSDGKVVAVFKKDGVAEGRINDALKILNRLKMLENNSLDGVEKIKISSYGVQWLEKTCPLIEREPEYEFALPTFRSVKLVGPDEFYGRKKDDSRQFDSLIDWAKWGAIGTLCAIPITIVIWWFP